MCTQPASACQQQRMVRVLKDYLGTSGDGYSSSLAYIDDIPCDSSASENNTALEVHVDGPLLARSSVEQLTQKIVP